MSNQIILGIKSKYVNKVYFWWHADESDNIEPVTYANIYQISKSFNEFVDSLYEYVEERIGNFEDYFEDQDDEKIKNLIDSG